MSVAVRLEGKPGGAGAFAVPSHSSPGESHVIFWQHEAAHWCGCVGHELRGSCRHVEAVALAVEVEARQLLEQATPESRADAAARLARIEEEFAR